MDRLPPPNKSLPQPSITLPADMLLNSTKEPLRVIVTPYLGVSHLPSDVQQAPTALLVFKDLTECFKLQGEVSEGLLGNLIWGFEQSGRDPRMVAAGLTELRKLGYVTYSDAAGTPISEHGFSADVPIWIRYTQKMVSLFVRR